MAATELGPGAAFGPDGRYRIERLLSTGGMATVWLGNDARLHRPVALKFLSDVLALDHDYVTRFSREARVAAGLSHPRLVSIYDFSGEPPRPFLVMEYIPGGTLDERLRSASGQLDAGQVIRDLLGAVAHIHSAGVVHRDIKPANLLIGPDGRIRLTDFGIAQPPDGTRMTATGMVLGTARYLAPEVLRGQPADARSDLYACGVVLRSMLGARAARRLRELAARLTEDEPSRRPRTANEALAWLDGEPSDAATAPTRSVAGPAEGTAPTRRAAVSQTPPVTWERHTVRVRVPRRAAAVAGLVVVAVVALAVVLSGGGGGNGGGSAVSSPPGRTAPLNSQLQYLDRSIDTARR